MAAQNVKKPLLERANQYLILIDKIFSNGNLSMHAKLVGLYLAGCAHDQDAWPSLNTIAKRCRIGNSKTVKIIKNLKSQGLLEELGYPLGGEVADNA